MSKLWMLSLSNIRKSKGASISLLIIIFVAAILLNLGLLTKFNFSNSFDQRANEMNSSHITTAMTKQSYQDRYLDFFTEYQGVTEVDGTEVIYLLSSKFKYGTGTFSYPMIFINTNMERTVSVLSFVGDHNETDDRDIYVSYILHTGGGYELGDEIIINYREKDYSFNIAGFTEDIILGSTAVGCLGFHLPEESYDRFQKELNDENTKGILLQARLDDPKASDEMLSNFQKNELEKSQTGIVSTVWLCSINLAKIARTGTADIGGAIIVCFSLIILFVSLLVIKFRVSTSIDDGMSEIGALKALGFTSRQIIASFLLQFMLIAFVGALSGILISYIAVGQFSSMFSAQTGIVWRQGFDLKSSFFSFIIILLSVVFITLLSSRQINKLHPIIALRFGIMTHSFKKNHYPLSSTRGGLNFVLAMKYMITNLRQNLMIALIIAAVTFASIFGIVIYYNIVTDNKAFFDMIGKEMCSVSTSVKPGEDAKILRNDIAKMDGVRRAIIYDFASVTIREESAQVYITDDFSLLDYQQVYEGRYPLYDNEVALNGILAELVGKRVGDTIVIQIGDKSTEYLISGLQHSANYLGMDLAMTVEGVRQIEPDYQYYNIYIYLEDEIDSNVFINELTEQFGDRFERTINVQKMTDSQLGVYVSIVTIFAYFILIITSFIVILILYLIIKAMIIRRKREFGIQKAVGYTTFQLMTQTSLSFLPIILLGAVIGSVVGSIYMNSLITVLFHGIGIMKVNFVVPTQWIGILCLGISLLSYLVSMLVAWRIRKITPYTLIVE